TGSLNSATVGTQQDEIFSKVMQDMKSYVQTQIQEALRTIQTQQAAISEQTKQVYESYDARAPPDTSQTQVESELIVKVADLASRMTGHSKAITKIHKDIAEIHKKQKADNKNIEQLSLDISGQFSQLFHILDKAVIQVHSDGQSVDESFESTDTGQDVSMTDIVPDASLA
ncbi:MAG: hypothetical protein AAFQ92_30340, partial [Bacteroidota bacterium]